MNKEIQSYIIAKVLEAKAETVTYYKNGYFPELYEYTGTDQSGHLQRAKDSLEQFKTDLLHYRENGRFDLLDISKTERANYIRLYAIEQREIAEDFSENPYIKIQSLKRCINACKLLIEFYPVLSQYSFRFLASRQKISL
jgi:hypothetical protein